MESLSERFRLKSKNFRGYCSICPPLPYWLGCLRSNSEHLKQMQEALLALFQAAHPGWRHQLGWLQLPTFWPPQSTARLKLVAFHHPRPASKSEDVSVPGLAPNFAESSVSDSNMHGKALPPPSVGPSHGPFCLRQHRPGKGSLWGVQTV